MPQKTVPPARAEVADAEIGNAAQPLHLFPQPGLGARIQDVELELAQVLEVGACFELANLREGEDLPHGCRRPQAMELEIQLAVFDGELIVGEPEVVLEPV